VPDIALLDVADPSLLWSSLGFVLDDGYCWVDDLCFRLDRPGRGVVAWALTDADELDELPTSSGVAPPKPPSLPIHPNGVTRLDHLVISTPDLPRTIASFEAIGLRLRRTRQAGTPEHPFTQAFFKLEQTILEVIGAEPVGPGPAQFWGLAFIAPDLDATVSGSSGQIRPPKDAVQAGRRIATLDRGAGSTVPMAFMSAAADRPTG
jgi:catechol 2,3-dioxygenase-like lactoylglutathione lyase family enzyme